MNLAWEHPLTGLREQTEEDTLSEMEKEARFRAWNSCPSICECGHLLSEHAQDLEGKLCELCECDRFELGKGGGVKVYSQEPIGKVTLEAGPYVDPFTAIRLDREKPGYVFAWTDPEDGKRKLLQSFPRPLAEQLKRMQSNGEHVPEVIVYATWPAFVVRRSDPEPPPFQNAGAPAIPLGPPPEDKIARRKTDLDSLAILDESTAVAAHTAWALLDIAESLRRLWPGGTPITNRATTDAE